MKLTKAEISKLKTIGWKAENLLNDISERTGSKMDSNLSYELRQMVSKTIELISSYSDN